jgi:hypothetical protein
MNQNGDLVAFDRFNQIDWTFQKARITALAERYRAKIIMDSTGVGDPIFEDLKRAGLSIEGIPSMVPEVEPQIFEGYV